MIKEGWVNAHGIYILNWLYMYLQICLRKCLGFIKHDVLIKEYVSYKLLKCEHSLLMFIIINILLIFINNINIY